MCLNSARFTRFVLGIVLVCLAVPGCRATVTTVVLVRHAEKGSGYDPPLSAAGQVRAEALSEVLDAADLTAIYVTQYQRTQQTAAPTVAASGVPQTEISVGGTAEAHGQQVAEHILEHHRGGCILVVGHSNTVPWIIHSLGVDPAPHVAGTEYDRFFVVLRKAGSTRARLIDAQYGP